MVIGHFSYCGVVAVLEVHSRCGDGNARLSYQYSCLWGIAKTLRLEHKSPGVKET